MADVARQDEVATSLIYKRRRDVVAARTGAAFVPAAIIDRRNDLRPAARSEPAAVVELAGGAGVTIGATASASMVSGPCGL